MSTDLPSGLSAIDRRSLLIGASLALTAGAAYAATPRRSENRLARQKLGNIVPLQIGSWQFASAEGVVVPREDEAAAQDGYDQVLTRTYSSGDEPAVMLLLAYGSTQGGSLQLHRPETCYPGQGFRLSNFSDHELSIAGSTLVEGRTFTAQRDDRVERLLYWTRISNDFPRNTAQEYRAILTSILKGVIPDGILVRLSTLEPDIGRADAALARFADLLVRSVTVPNKGILIGTSVGSR
jgi:EpsI family protein